ncbi:MAG: ISL3 family transposase, partial [Betaproteobacteria bacterium]|nr:ISL3 family transposase [Betaproteobacteria bacterium]
LESTGAVACCSGCGKPCPLKDHAPERQWRHLDTMQFTTTILARVPRTKCEECGVKTCSVPWAEPHGRYTLMFEAFAVQVLQAAATVEQARMLLRLNWESMHRIMERAVERGMQRRTIDEVRHVGMDEKSFGRGHDYVSVMTDIDASRVLEVVPGHDGPAADTLWNTLADGQKENVEAVAMDMWPAFETSAQVHVPQAEIVHDRFHISKHLNEAVDKIRRQEHKALLMEGDETLKGTKQLWLYNPENISDEQWAQFELLRDMELKTSKGWAIREQFRWFWEYTYAGNARRFFALWYLWASESELQPIIKVANMLKKRLANILTWFRHPISNGMAEGFNSRIQSLKSAARGFRSFANYRIRILFFCGKLDLKPTFSSH